MESLPNSSSKAVKKSVKKSVKKIKVSENDQTVPGPTIKIVIKKIQVGDTTIAIELPPHLQKATRGRPEKSLQRQIDAYVREQLLLRDYNPDDVVKTSKKRKRSPVVEERTEIDLEFEDGTFWDGWDIPNGDTEKSVSIE